MDALGLALRMPDAERAKWLGRKPEESAGGPIVMSNDQVDRLAAEILAHLG